MGETFDNAKLAVRHVEDADTPETAYEGGKRPENTGHVEIGVEIDGYFHPLASVKAGHFLGGVAAAREANRQRQSEQTPPPAQQQPQQQATTPGWGQEGQTATSGVSSQPSDQPPTPAQPQTPPGESPAA